MADFFTEGWSLDPSRSADSNGRVRREAAEHAGAKLGHSHDLWVLGKAVKNRISVRDAGNILRCTAARCNVLTGNSGHTRTSTTDLIRFGSGRSPASCRPADDPDRFLCIDPDPTH